MNPDRPAASGKRFHVIGHAAFVGDVRFDHQLHMHVVRSPVAAGRLRAIDRTAALAMPGVAAIWTARDVDLPPMAVRVAQGEDVRAAHRQPVLARDDVRYVGEPVAAVFAETAGIAADAAERVVLQIDAASPTLSARPDPNAAGPADKAEIATLRGGFGDIEAAFAAADRHVERTLRLERDGATPLEPRGASAQWARARQSLTVRTAARAIHHTRDAIAAALKLPSAAVEIEAPHVGGSFGLRAELCAEDVLVAAAAHALDCPVLWLEDRPDHFAAAPQARGLEAHARAAVNEDGTLLALDVEFWLDQGAYIGPAGLTVAELLVGLLPGPYAIKAYRAVGHIRATNKPQAGMMRGAGRLEATFVRERLLDAVADALSIDPMEMRRRNLPAPQSPQLPPLDVLGLPLPRSGTGVQRLVDDAVKHFALDAVRRRVAERRREGVHTGFGAAVFLDASGSGPFDHVRISVDGGGHLEVVTAAPDLGQGTASAIAQIVSGTLGVAPEHIRVTSGRTARTGSGGTAMLSGGTMLCGTAALRAAQALRDKILRNASAQLHVPASALSINAGRVVATDGSAAEALELGALSRAMAPDTLTRPQGHGLVAEGWSTVDAVSTAHGFAAAVVEVDAGTGLVDARELFVAFDVGSAIDKPLVAAQIEGAALQGVAGALFTSRPLDEAGKPLIRTLAAAMIPPAAALPKVAVLIAEDTPTPQTPLGTHGAGSCGIVGVGAAIAAALDAALDRPDFASTLPVSPRSVYEALHPLPR